MRTPRVGPGGPRIDGRKRPTSPTRHTPRVARDIALMRFLREHHGAIGLTELQTLGYTRDTVRKLVERETLVPVRRGAYRTGASAPTLSTTLRCCLVVAGPGAVIGRASAAHRLGLIDFAPRIHDIATTHRAACGRREGMRVFHAPTLSMREISIVDGLGCSTAPRTILDLAAVTRSNAEFKLLRRAVRQATVRYKPLPGLLTEMVEDRGRFPGSRVLTTLLDEHLERTSVQRSDLETAFFDLCRSGGIPLPSTNVVLEGHEVDTAWIEARVIVELDTYEFHGDVRSFERDRERDADLAVAGYRTMRVTGARLDREPGKVLRQTRSLVLGSPFAPHLEVVRREKRQR